GSAFLREMSELDACASELDLAVVDHLFESERLREVELLNFCSEFHLLVLPRNLRGAREKVDDYRTVVAAEHLDTRRLPIFFAIPLDYGLLLELTGQS